MKKDKNYWHALAVLVGYTIGVGMFGLPFIIKESGVLTFFVFILFLGPVQYLIHLIFANIIIVTETFHRLPGYAEIYLGSKGKNFVLLAKLIGSYSAMLAYTIITGIFLYALLGPYLGGNEFIYASILYLIQIIIIFFGISTIASVELIMTGLMLLVVILISIKGWPVMNIHNFTLVNWQKFLLPYGAMLFALDGVGAIPIVVKILNKDAQKIKSVVKVGTIIPIVVTIIFVLSVLGISGQNTTDDSLAGIKLILNDGVIMLALIFGILTMITSFLPTGEAVKESLWWDYKINKNISWLIAVIVPYTLYVFGIRNISTIISLAGAVAGGICAIVLILVFIELKKRENKLPLFNKIPSSFLTYFLITLFTCGLFYEIYYFCVKKL